jgi:hypothetical protein
MVSDSYTGPPTVRFGRRQSKGVLLGLSGIRLVAIGAALTALTLAMFTFGVSGLVLAGPIWVPLLASAFVRWNGQAAIEALPTLLHWGARSATKQSRYLARASAPRPAGTMALPGDAAALRVHVDMATGAAMIHDPHRQTLAAVLRVSHPAYVLLAPDDQTRRVAAWGRVLAGLASTGTCASVQVLESTLPDPGHGVRGWFTSQGVHNGSWAAKEYDALMSHAAPSSSTHRTLIVVSLDLKRAARAIRDAGRGVSGAADVLRGEMTTFETSVRAAELRTEGWLGPAELAVVVRQAYDPSADGMRTTDPGADLATAGPVAVEEHWDHLRHDAAFSTVLWISEWPRIDVAPHFLHSLVFQQGVRKTISIIAKPLGTAEALRSIRKEKVEYVTDAQQNARIGRIADLSADQEYADVLARERALISGHADMRFSGFIAITAPSRDELSAAVAATQRCANQCGCETRIMYSQQAQAFAVAALPIGRPAS